MSLRLLSWTLAFVLGHGWLAAARAADATNWLSSDSLAKQAQYVTSADQRVRQGDPFIDDPQQGPARSYTPEEVNGVPDEAFYPGYEGPEHDGPGCEEAYQMDLFHCGKYGGSLTFWNGFWSLPKGRVFVGADFLSVKPRFGSAVALRHRDGIDDTLVQHDFNFERGARVFAGYRIPDCNSQFQLTYTTFKGDSEFGTGPLGVNGQVLTADGELLIGDAGETVTSNTSIDVNTYDIDFSKTVPILSSPNCCEAVCGFCPPWELTWTVSARISDIQWSNSLRSFDDNELQVRNESIASFQGAGPRLGFEARRYFLPKGCTALFARGSLSLLLGTFQGDTLTANFRGEQPNVLTQRDEHTATVPVTDLELGGTLDLGPCMTMSAGYFWQSFHDPGSTQLFFFDDLNMLAFDGYFVKAEWSF